MESFIHQVLSGLATGGIYASMALALVMIYQSTHHLNFAQGEMAMASTYLAWSLIAGGVPYWLAFVLTVGLSFVAGVVIERVVLRPLANAPVLALVIVFIGLLVIFNSVAGWIFTYTIKTFPSPFPEGMGLGRFMSAHELGAIGVTLLVLAALYAFFRYTPLGLAMRAAAQNPESSRLVGIRVGWMLALGWGLAAAIGSIAGMMVAPIVFLDPNMMGGILLYAFAPKPDPASASLIIPAAALLLTVAGLRGLVRMRTWGVLALGAAGCRAIEDRSSSIASHDRVVHLAPGVMNGLDLLDEGRPGLERVLECLERVPQLLRRDAHTM